MPVCICGMCRYLHTGKQVAGAPDEAEGCDLSTYTCEVCGDDECDVGCACFDCKVGRHIGCGDLTEDNSPEEGVRACLATPDPVS